MVLDCIRFGLPITDTFTTDPPTGRVLESRFQRKRAFQSRSEKEFFIENASASIPTPVFYPTTGDSHPNTPENHPREG